MILNRTKQACLSVVIGKDTILEAKPQRQSCREPPLEHNYLAATLGLQCLSDLVPPTMADFIATQARHNTEHFQYDSNSIDFVERAHN